MEEDLEDTPDPDPQKRLAAFALTHALQHVS